MILEQVQQILTVAQGKTIQELADQIPDLCGRDDAGDILYLLLRLDKRFDNDNDRWFSKIGKKSDPEAEILKAVKVYFSQKNPRGELLIHLTNAVAEATGKDSEQIQTVILKHYQILQGGKMILNRMKEPATGG